MIAATVEELTPLIGTRPACRALGASPATVYRRRRPAAPRTARAAAPRHAMRNRSHSRLMEMVMVVPGDPALLRAVTLPPCSRVSC